MVKTTGPLFSLAASGTLGEAIVYSSNKGRSYVRQHVTPANPQTGAQIGRRAMTKFLSKQWASISAVDQATWQDLADQMVVSPDNAYISQNLERWHIFLTPGKTYPIGNTGTPSTSALSAAGYEENRIKLRLDIVATNQGMGTAIFGTPGAAITTAVGNCIIADPKITVATHYIYWTPPDRIQYTFDTISFSIDGVQVAANLPQTATP